MPGRPSTTSSGWLFLVLTAAATAALLERRLREQCQVRRHATLVGLRVALVFGLALDVLSRW